MNNKPENKVSSSSSWGEDIEQAMKQIEKPTSKTKSVVSKNHTTPPWVLFVSIAILLVLIVLRAPSYVTPHPVGKNRDMESGSRVAMLIVAEEIEQYGLENGKLPKDLPSDLGRSLGIEYAKTNNDHFELQMTSSEGRLVLRDGSSTISVL